MVALLQKMKIQIWFIFHVITFNEIKLVIRFLHSFVSNLIYTPNLLSKKDDYGCILIVTELSGRFISECFTLTYSASQLKCLIQGHHQNIKNKNNNFYLNYCRTLSLLLLIINYLRLVLEF